VGQNVVVTRLAIRPAGGLFARGGRDGAVKLWRPHDGTLARSLEARALSPEPGAGRGLIGGIQWMLGLEESTDLVRSLAISPDGRLLTGVCWDGSVRWWGLPEGELLQKLRFQGDNFFTLSGAGRMMIDRKNDGEVRVWNLDAARLSHLPIKEAKPADLSLARQTLQNWRLNSDERNWLEFIEALMRWKWRFDVEVGDELQRIPIGEFDIEIEG
jgi:WD40 repeat protein